MSRKLTCNPADPENETVAAAAEALIAGEVVVIPTETQYSLSVRADNEKAMKKIKRIKKRNEALKPALFVKDIDAANKFCVVGKQARRLAEGFLPGPLTLVMPGRRNQKAVAADFESELGFGIRISSSPLIAAIIERVPFPVTATSANISGETTPASIEAITELLGDEVGLYLDGGPCRGITPSTVVYAGEDIRILRPGLIGEAEIKRYLGEESING
ncbi:MAG: threonylcarbamoyl-AMP synthase [FCB group bacterium]|nr:threonylcarbamoyl-AMP synthase [FCB group bacterium]